MPAKKANTTVPIDTEQPVKRTKAKAKPSASAPTARPTNLPTPAGPVRTGYTPNWTFYKPSPSMGQRVASALTRAGGYLAGAGAAAIPLAAYTSASDEEQRSALPAFGPVGALAAGVDRYITQPAKAAIKRALSPQQAAQPAQPPQQAQPAQATQPIQPVPSTPLASAPPAVVFSAPDPMAAYYDTAFANMGLSPDARAAAIQARLGDTATRRPGLYDVSPDARNRIYKQVDKSGRTTYTGVGVPEAPAAMPTMDDYIRELMASPYTTPEHAAQYMQALGSVEAQRTAAQGARDRQTQAIEAADRRLDKTLRSKENTVVANMIIQDIQRIQDTLLSGQLPGPVPKLLTPEQKKTLQEDLMARMKMLNTLLYEDAQDTAGYAEGGEVAPTVAIDPVADGKAAAMESGDYVFPAEAVRYYGVKMLKDMVQKALMAE